MNMNVIYHHITLGIMLREREIRLHNHIKIVLFLWKNNS